MNVSASKRIDILSAVYSNFLKMKIIMHLSVSIVKKLIVATVSAADGEKHAHAVGKNNLIRPCPRKNSSNKYMITNSGRMCMYDLYPGSQRCPISCPMIQSNWRNANVRSSIAVLLSGNC